MIYLLQILNLLPKSRLDDFEALFEDLEFELEEMGYKDCPEDLIQGMLDNHFDIFLECEKQLKFLTECILKEGCLQSAVNLTKLKRAS